MATSSSSSGNFRLTLKSDYPAKKALVTAEAKSNLAALVVSASKALSIEADALARYSIRAVGLGSDVLALADGNGAGANATKSLAELGFADLFQVIFFAPVDVKPPRKKRGKDGKEESKAGDDAKFAGITSGNVLGKLKTAKGKMKNTLLEYCERYWQEIYKTQRREITALPKGALIDILQRDELDAKEPDLFGLVLEWGKNEAKKAGGTGSSDELKKILVDILPHIRFPVFSATEMALTVTPARLLTSDQELQLYTHIGKVTAKKVPEAKTEEKKGGKPVHPRVAGFISVSRKPYGVLREKTARFEDNTGIFYWIGTNEGKSTTYTNPIEAEVAVRMSTLVGSYPSLADRNYTSSPVENSYGSDSSPWIEFEFRRYKVRPTSYFLAQDQDHYLRNWRMEGSDDGTSWTTLRDHVSDSTIHSTSRWAFFDLKADKFYRRIKLQMTGASHNGSTNMDVTEMEFFGYIAPATTPS